MSESAHAASSAQPESAPNGASSCLVDLCRPTLRSKVPAHSAAAVPVFAAWRLLRRPLPSESALQLPFESAPRFFPVFAAWCLRLRRAKQKRCFAVFAFFWFSCVDKQYFLGLLGRGCGAQETSVGADANECPKGMMDGHDKTSAVPRARIHDIHVVHMQKTLVPRLRPLLLVCAVKVCAV